MSECWWQTQWRCFHLLPGTPDCANDDDTRGDSLNILPFAVILCHFNIECEKMKPQKLTKPPENAVLPKAEHTQDWINLHNIAVWALHLYFHVISLWCGGDSHEPVKLAQNGRYYVQICNIHILYTHIYLVEGVGKQERFGKCLQTYFKTFARSQQYLRAESTLHLTLLTFCTYILHWVPDSPFGDSGPNYAQHLSVSTQLRELKLLRQHMPANSVTLALTMAALDKVRHSPQSLNLFFYH